MRNLDQLNVQEMDVNEMRSIEGGGVSDIWYAAAVVAIAAYDAITDFAKGFVKGFEDSKPK